MPLAFSSFILYGIQQKYSDYYYYWTKCCRNCALITTLISYNDCGSEITIKNQSLSTFYDILFIVYFISVILKVESVCWIRLIWMKPLRSVVVDVACSFIITNWTGAISFDLNRSLRRPMQNCIREKQEKTEWQMNLTKNNRQMHRLPLKTTDFFFF